MNTRAQPAAAARHGFDVFAPQKCAIDREIVFLGGRSGMTNLLFSYYGRISVAKFWLGFLMQFLIFGVGLALIMFAALTVDPQLLQEGRETPPNPAAGATLGLGIIVLVILLAVMNFAVMVKRCHDRNKSGWFSLLSLIPYVGFFWWVIDLGILEGHHGPNEYGPDPQGRPPRPQFAGTQATGQWTSAGQFDPDQLRKLKALLDDGLITQDEYDRKRQQLMGV
jgi:uncharacterized membrane protein YhaH (DUF805 family)